MESAATATVQRIPARGPRIDFRVTHARLYAENTKGPDGPFENDSPDFGDVLSLLRRLLTTLLTTLFLSGHRAHHLSCRTGPPGRAYLAKRAGSLRQTGCDHGGKVRDRHHLVVINMR